MNGGEVVMDVEGFNSYGEVLKFVENGKFREKGLWEEKIELWDGKGVYVGDGFKVINEGRWEVGRRIRS